MSKPQKKKSSKPKVSGLTLGAFALIISLGALGLGLYQFMFPPGPTVYVNQYNEYIVLDTLSTGDFRPQLNVTYTAQPGDIVLLEFSCQIYLDPIGLTEIGVYFNNNGTYTPNSIHLSADTGIFTPCYMRNYIEPSEGGEYTVVIVTSIDDGGTSSNIRNCLLTVTVY